MARAADKDSAKSALRADAQRNRAAIIEAAADVLHRDGVNASLEEIARRAGVGSATLHRHFSGHRSLLAAVFEDRVEELCAAADTMGQAFPDGEALWRWLGHIAHHCVAEKALVALLRNAFGDSAAQGRSAEALARAGQGLLDRAREAGSVEPGVTIQDLLLLVNAVADVCSDNGADVDHLLNLVWSGARRATAPGP